MPTKENPYDTNREYRRPDEPMNHPYDLSRGWEKNSSRGPRSFDLSGAEIHLITSQLAKTCKNKPFTIHTQSSTKCTDKDVVAKKLGYVNDFHRRSRLGML